MIKTTVAAAAVAATTWGAHPPPEKPIVHRHHFARHHKEEAKPAPTPEIVRLRNDVAELRAELEAVRAQVRRSPPEQAGWESVLLPHLSDAGGMKLASLPDLRLPNQEPEWPVPPLPEIPPAVDDVARRVREAVDYLIHTATPGYTMVRQGPDVAIGRLHPAFAVRLADAIRKAREEGLEHAGVFSAYRPPAFGVGGFSNKFNSLHSYGLAADVTGIGGAGSHAAHLWDHIVRSVGLFLPYGPNNRAEFNHTQLIPAKRAAFSLRATITAKQPKELRAMWTASGVKDYLDSKLPEADFVRK